MVEKEETAEIFLGGSIIVIFHTTSQLLLKNSF